MLFILLFSNRITLFSLSLRFLYNSTPNPSSFLHKIWPFRLIFPPSGCGSTTVTISPTDKTFLLLTKRPYWEDILGTSRALLPLHAIILFKIKDLEKPIIAIASIIALTTLGIFCQYFIRAVLS